MSEASPAGSDSLSDVVPGAFVRDFLFGEAPRPGRAEVRAPLAMDGRTEGWMGIPHGGIGMGAILELAGTLRGLSPDRISTYPLAVDYRLGGASLRSGDTVEAKVILAAGGATGTISGAREALPYLSATVAYGSDESSRRTVFSSYLPPRFTGPGESDMPLPYLGNCFVCGVERRHPGLERRFWLLNGPERIVVSTAGFDSGDREPFYRFRTDDRLHPLPLLALLDETLGWAGFMATGSGAVTVRIGYTLYRDVRVGERLVFFGRNEKVKGSPTSRLFYWASGGAAAVDDKGGVEVIAAASGQYLGMPELTEQMKRALIPPDWMRRVFALAGRC